MSVRCPECGSPGDGINGPLCICDGPPWTPPCGGSGELVAVLSPPGVDHRDPAFETRELPCPGCPDCRPALSATDTDEAG